MTIEISAPETEALIERHLRSGRFHDIDELLRKALGSLEEQPSVEAEAAPPERRKGQVLIDAFADVRGLLTDEEIDRMFARNPSPARPVDLP